MRQFWRAACVWTEGKAFWSARYFGLGLSMSQIQTSSTRAHCVWIPGRPVHDFHILLCQKSGRVTCCVGRSIVLDIHKVSSKMSITQGSTQKYHREAWCCLGGWGFHPAPPIHSSLHGGWYIIPCLRGRDYQLWIRCTHLSVTPLACCARKHGHHREIAWSKIHHWRHSASNTRGPTFCVFAINTRQRLL